MEKRIECITLEEYLRKSLCSSSEKAELSAGKYLFLAVYNKNNIPANSVYEVIGQIALVAKIRIPTSDGSMASACVPHDAVERMGFSDKEFIDMLKKEPRNPVVFIDMSPMLTVTQRTEENDLFPFGAAALFYDGVIEQAIESLGTDEFFILPSSKEELILVGCNAFDNPDARGLLDIVRSVNGTDCITPDLYLGDFVMAYRHGMFSTVAAF